MRKKLSLRTAAGDTFIGSFIVARQQGMTVKDALQRASAASAIAVSRAGAQESIPNVEEIATFLNDHCRSKGKLAIQ
ncbi:PfkB family carbohydrate kinase [Paenibacillus sp. NPDC056579]|uniref:PfkB family carbohydrate kinase n=1 Tax=Paenibacillus sp. NPDC056579 TaxID=3345871 RepID=UPI0036C15313